MPIFDGAFRQKLQAANARAAAPKPAAPMDRRLQQETVQAPQARQPYQAARQTGPLPQFELMRRRASQRAEASGQQANDALQRRFAAMGGLNSGAAIKQQQLTSEAVARQREDALAGVDAAEQQERMRQQDLADERNFQATEADRLREFQGAEAARGRNMQRDMTGLDVDYRNRALSLEDAFRNKQLWTQNNQFNAQFAADRADQRFNKDMATSQIDDDFYRAQMAKKYGGIGNPVQSADAARSEAEKQQRIRNATHRAGRF